MKMTALRRAMLVAVPLAVALVATSAALAEQPTVIDCTLRFQLSGWSPSYERVDGTGIVACSDDTSLPVFVQARGAGLTTGKPKISAGTGKFAGARQISDVFGTYAQGEMYVPVAQSGEVNLLGNGKVALALAGKDEGFDLRSSIAGFAIHPQ